MVITRSSEKFERVEVENVLDSVACPLLKDKDQLHILFFYLTSLTDCCFCDQS